MSNHLKQNSKTGKWSYRFFHEGIDHRKSGFATKTEANKALVKLKAQLLEGNKPQKMPTVTLTQVYTHYLEHGSSDKAPATVKKQEAMWHNHVSQAFGKRQISSIPSGELNNFLLALYTGTAQTCKQDGGYSYAYVEGFLKFFFLMFGYAQRMNYISRDQYSIVCEDRGTKLQMPRQQKEENSDVIVYSKSQLDQMEALIKNSSLYTAFLFGKQLGLRISECFALCWHDVDFQKGTISINKQLNYDDSKKCFYLATPKTKSSVRSLQAPESLLLHLQALQKQQEIDKATYSLNYKATEYVMDRRVYGTEIPIQGYDFIQRQANGTLLTHNSMKSWSLKFKAKLGIDFKYHYLRHTHASELAMLNIPIPALMQRMGHSKIDTTRKYYLGQTTTGDELMKKALEQL